MVKAKVLKLALISILIAFTVDGGGIIYGRL